MENFSRYPNLQNQIKNILKNDNNALDFQNVSDMEGQIELLCLRETMLLSSIKISNRINELIYDEKHFIRRLIEAKDWCDLYAQLQLWSELRSTSNAIYNKIKSDVNLWNLTDAKDWYILFSVLWWILDEQQKTDLIRILLGKIKDKMRSEHYLTDAKNWYDLYIQWWWILDDKVKEELCAMLLDKIRLCIDRRWDLTKAKYWYDLYMQWWWILDDEVKEELYAMLLDKIVLNIERRYGITAMDWYDLYIQWWWIIDDKVKEEWYTKLLNDINLLISTVDKHKEIKDYLSAAKRLYEWYMQLWWVLDNDAREELCIILLDKIRLCIDWWYLTNAKYWYILFSSLWWILDERQRTDIMKLLLDKIRLCIVEWELTDAKNWYDLLQLFGDFPINKDLEAYFEQNKSQIMKYRALSPQSFFDLEYFEHLTSQFPLLLKRPNVYKPLLEKNYDFIKSNFENTYISWLWKQNNWLWKLINERKDYEYVGAFLDIQRKYFSNVTLESVDDDCIHDIINYSLERSLRGMFVTYEIWIDVFWENIFNRKQLNFMYISSLRLWEPIPDFPRDHDNILDYLEDNEVLLDIPKDRGFIQSPKPWSKEWFLEKRERIKYLNSDDIQTFIKFWTVVALGILEWSTSLEDFQNYYDSQLRLMNLSNERSIVLQLGEVLNLIVTKQNFIILNDVSDFNLGDACKEFIDKFGIGHKWKTIISLLFTKEINATKQIQGDCSLKNISNAVYHKIQWYNEILKWYDNISAWFRISLWLEYEVTISISDEYHLRTHSDYKQDIEILSEYSGIAKWSDAIHEIATKPTDNPYLLILELSLLQSLDFINLNFDMKGYERWSRGFHISVWWEYGIENNWYTNFMQNILIAANLWWINAWRSVKKVNTYSNIREKWSDCDAVFSNNKTPVTELRSLSIDTAESFERCMVYLFDMSLWNQALKKLTTLHENDIMKITKKFQTKDDWKQYLSTNNFLVDNDWICDEQWLQYAFHFFCLMQDVMAIVKDHNDNFYTNETDGYLRDKLRSTEHTLYRDNKKMFWNLLDTEDTNELVELIDEKTKISPVSFFQVVTSKFQNTFTFINNLYLKGVDSKWNNSSVNAGAVFDCTKIQNDHGLSYYDSQPKACRKTVFDHLEEETPVRSWRYQIQWSSDKMIVNVLQEALIKYHNDIKLSLGT